LAFAHRQHIVWWAALLIRFVCLRPTISSLLLNSTTSLFLQEGQTHVRDIPPSSKVNPPRTNISFPHSSHIIPSMQPHFLFTISTTTKANVSTNTVKKHKQAHINAGDSTHNQLHEITCVSFSTINATVTKPNRTTPPLVVNFILALLPRIFASLSSFAAVQITLVHWEKPPSISALQIVIHFISTIVPNHFVSNFKLAHFPSFLCRTRSSPDTADNSLCTISMFAVPLAPNNQSPHTPPIRYNKGPVDKSKTGPREHRLSPNKLDF
jgi:hypothetical protein